jgi:hypothetical protein
MAGILDLNFDDPQSAGLLGLATGLLSAGGPSLKPVGLGQAMATGFQGMQAARKSALDQQREKLQTDLLMQQIAQATRKNKLINDAIESFSGNGQPQPSAATQALAQGAQLGDVGPTVTNAQRMDMISTQPPQGAAPAGSSYAGLPRQAVVSDLAFNDGKNIGDWMFKNSAPTDFAKQLRQAGIDPNSPEGQQYMLGNVKKQNYIAPTSLRPGGYVQDANGNINQLPHVPDGYQSIKGADGQWHIVPVEGGIQALQTSSAANTLGKTMGTLGQGVDGSGAPAYFLGVPPGTIGTQPQASSGLVPSMIGAESGGNQNAVSPKGAIGTTQLMPKTAAGLGVNPNDKLENVAGGVSYLNQLRQKYGDDKIALAAYNWGPKNVDIWMKSGADWNKLPTETRNYVDTVMKNAGQGGQAAPLQTAQQQSSVIRPGNAPGFNASQETLATGNAKRYNDLLTLASDSPTRVNVYDNILNLSRQGVDTGPGQAWKNAVKGYVANAPVLSMVSKGWKDDVSGFQELNKFLYQNAQRNWQAAGGTGTDAQLDAYSQSNPNDKMFPQALQAMAQWGKAGELALQAKINAAQSWKDANNGNVANLDQFERSWRNNFDPRVFQLNVMNPQEQKAYVGNLSPADAKALLAKRAAIRQMGGF